jgi:hypothetical protein
MNCPNCGREPELTGKERFIATLHWAKWMLVLYTIAFGCLWLTGNW